MSKKSLKRKEKQIPEISARDALAMKKQTMKEASIAYLGCAIVFFLLAATTLIAGFAAEDASQSKTIIFFAVPMILVITSVFAVLFVRRFIVFQKLLEITSTSEDTVKITCKKVSFFEHPISKGASKVICVILTDENGKKYYDVVNIFYLDKKEARAKLINEKITVNCYKSTNCVKSLSKAYKDDRLDFYVSRH